MPAAAPRGRALPPPRRSAGRPRRRASLVPARFDGAHRSTATARRRTRATSSSTSTRPALAYEVGDSLGVHAAQLSRARRRDHRASWRARRRRGRVPRRHAAPSATKRSTQGLRDRPAVRRRRSRCSRRARRDYDESQRLQALAEGYPGAEPEEADLLDLLLAFPSARPPLPELISALDALQPRLYSIASSPKAQPRRSASHRRRGALRKARPRAQRRRLDLPRRPRASRAAMCRSSSRRRMASACRRRAMRRSS